MKRTKTKPRIFLQRQDCVVCNKCRMEKKGLQKLFEKINKKLKKNNNNNNNHNK